MRIDGRFRCGFIPYEAAIDSETVMLCHCTACQTLTGSAFRTFVLSREDGFALLSGQLKTYAKTGDSGVRRLQTFCPECGSPIYSASEGKGPRIYSIRVGTSRQRNDLVPRGQIWCRTAQPWIAGIGSLPGTDTQVGSCL
ncbi:GFA family protein [Microvirga sp. TS319]|uniref:GFA family protein n=1 Tax=Microvirga sp. TS319 TaxID=3241165 RepID=UPI00351A8A48